MVYCFTHIVPFSAGICWIPTAANRRPCNSRGLAICVAPNGLSCNDGRGGELQRNKFQLLVNFLPSQVVFYDILLYNVGPPWPPSYKVVYKLH